MCILCVIQKWSRRIATMLPWLVIPLIGLWALSQLLPPAFRFEITSPRLACVFVLLVTLFWYEILMPQLSAWRVRRNARLREKKRFEAIELQKLRKTATRRCRNCLTPYREQNPGGGKFMCSYCGHVSKRPVLDLPVPAGLGISNNGILKDLVGKSGRMLNEKVWSDSGGWMCGQDWLDNGNWVGGSFPGKGRRKHSGQSFFGDDHCLTEKSYSHALIFACRALTGFFLSIMWVWRKIFRVSTSGDDASVDAERRKMARRGENGANFQESRVEKARRKAEEKRKAKLTKEQWDEEDRKQREEVSRLVEERRRSRDEKIESDKDGRRGSTPSKEKVTKKETEKKRQERKSERDRGSSKSNSDVEELEKRAGRDSEKNRKCESDRRNNQRSVVYTAKSFNNDISKGALTNNYSREASGTKNLDNMKGTSLYPSRAAGGNSFGKGTINSVAGTREHKSNGHADQYQISVNRRETSQLERSLPKSNSSSEDKNAARPVLVEPQPYEAPKNPWLTRSEAVPSPSDLAVIGKPNGKSQSEVTSPSYKKYDNPINFGLPSPFPVSTNSFGSMSTSIGIQMSAESKFPFIGEALPEYLPEESDIFEDPCYVPDPVSLLGPVSESLDNFQLDLGFLTDMELEKPLPIKSTPISSEVIRPSPIESPLSRLRLHDERNASPSPFPTTPKAQDVQNTPVDGSCNGNENGTWQMWNTSPLGQDGGLLGAGASWLLSPDSNRSNKENVASPLHQKTMASLFKSDEKIRSGTQNFLPGSYHIGRAYGNSIPGCIDDPWLPETLFGPTLGKEENFSMNSKEGVIHNEPICKSPNGLATDHPFELSLADRWRKVDWTVQETGVNTSHNSSVVTRSPVGGVYSSLDVQSIWSYD
ncbi:uncharacterized protein LOC141718804 [Apium graveolens]|uniref:uncharacterized protein LOC141718804 n=1 Tax=Apium graveolens TaxID=4045 RepID=UPI003D792718